jgi:hypothetical protein
MFAVKHLSAVDVRKHRERLLHWLSAGQAGMQLLPQWRSDTGSGIAATRADTEACTTITAYSPE